MSLLDAYKQSLARPSRTFEQTNIGHAKDALAGNLNQYQMPEIVSESPAGASNYKPSGLSAYGSDPLGYSQEDSSSRALSSANNIDAITTGIQNIGTGYSSPKGITTQDYIKLGASAAGVASELLKAFGQSTLSGYLGTAANMANIGVSGYNVATGQAHGPDYVTLGSNAARIAGNALMQQGSQYAITNTNIGGAALNEAANYAKFGYDVYKVIDEGPQEGRGANAVTSGVGAGVGTAAGMTAGAAAGGAAAAVRSAYLIGNDIMQRNEPTSPAYTGGNILSTPFTFALDVGAGNAITQASGSKMPTAQFTSLPRQFEQTAYKSVEDVLSGHGTTGFKDWGEFAYDSTIGNVEDTIHYIEDEPGKAALSFATGGLSDIVSGLGNVMGFGGGLTEGEIQDQNMRKYATALEEYAKANPEYIYSSKDSPINYNKYLGAYATGPIYDMQHGFQDSYKLIANVPDLSDETINQLIHEGKFSSVVDQMITAQQQASYNFYQTMFQGMSI